MAKTNPIPAGTRNVTVNMPVRLAEALERLAAKSGVKLGRCCRAVLIEAVDNEAVLDSATEHFALNETSVIFSSSKAAPAIQVGKKIVEAFAPKKSPAKS